MERVHLIQYCRVKSNGIQLRDVAIVRRKYFGDGRERLCDHVYNKTLRRKIPRRGKIRWEEYIAGLTHMSDGRWLAPSDIHSKENNHSQILGDSVYTYWK